jgi:hypothetical protein
MAFATHHFELVVAIADNSGKTVPRTYEIPEGVVADFAEFSALIPSMLAAINGITAGLITGYRATQVTYEDTIVLPASGVENENQVIFSGKIQGDPGKSGILTVPAVDPAIFVAASGPGANSVNMAAAPVLAFIQLFDGAPGWTLSDGETWLTETVSGKRRHSKNSNG